MIQSEFNGNRLKTARIYNGISLTELANKAGISKQSISLYENNKIKPDYEKIRILSNKLNFPLKFFFCKEIMKTHTNTTYFRSQMSATRNSRMAQSAKLEFVAQMYEALSNYVEFPNYNDPKIECLDLFSYFEYDTQNSLYSQIEEIALKVRNYWGVLDGPIGDMQGLLEKNGIIITGFHEDINGIDAFSQQTVVDDLDIFLMAISLGSQISECRIRFDMAHELGHIILHPWSEDIDTISKDEFKNRELQANLFASAFLMPRESFIKDVISYPTNINYYKYLKKKWKVSIQAMIMRARNLGIITMNQYQYMVRQITKNGWRIKEPDDNIGRLCESVFQVAIDLLFDNNIFSPQTLLDYFEKCGIVLYPDTIEDLLHLKKNTLWHEAKTIKFIHIKK